MIALDLPIPPSVNRIRKLNRAEIWRKEKWELIADKLVTAQWAAAKHKSPSSSRPHMRERPFGITIYVSDNYGGDLDNIMKAVPDYLRRIEVISGDAKRYMRHIILSWCDSKTAPEGIRVEVWPWDQPVVVKRSAQANP